MRIKDDLQVVAIFGDGPVKVIVHEKTTEYGSINCLARPVFELPNGKESQDIPQHMIDEQANAMNQAKKFMRLHSVNREKALQDFAINNAEVSNVA